ncbi:hypothetical protein MBLNU13_g10272t1 [Cladosporium sp. NU13]
MKCTSIICLALSGLASAYPDILQQLGKAGATRSREKRQTPYSTPPFDAQAQYVDTTGPYSFVAPGPNDQRGPCPGLNAMANHGYLPHDGIVTIPQFIESTGKVFGMGVDLSTFLAVYGSVFDGNLYSWSIGGPDDRVSIPLNLLGQPQGISGSHNKYEGDASPTRGDLYVYGNDYDLVLSRFQRLYDAGKAKDEYDLQLLTDLRHVSFQESLNTNPYFFNAPFAGVIAQPAAWSFIYRFMANKSAEYPSGRLDAEMANQYPEFASIGGNTGTVNSFVGLDPANLTGGVFDAGTLLKGNNLFCYAMQLLIQGTPDILSGLFTDTNAAEDKLGSVINAETDSLGCPKLNNIDKDQFSKYPGYTQSYDSYTPLTKNGLLK